MIKFQSLLELDKYKLIINTLQDPLASTFVFDLLLQQLIKEKRSMLLILLAENVHHYSAVSMQCGINLKNQIESGLIQVLDIFDYNIEDNLNQFIKEIHDKVSSLPEKSFVLIDDIRPLETMDFSAKSAYIFIQKLLNSLSLKHGCLFLGVTWIKNIRSNYNLCINDLLYQCDVWLDCDKPATGYSQQINGILRCFYQNNSSRLNLNYKISNRNVILAKF